MHVKRLLLQAAAGFWLFEVVRDAMKSAHWLFVRLCYLSQWWVLQYSQPWLLVCSTSAIFKASFPSHLIGLDTVRRVTSVRIRAQCASIRWWCWEAEESGNPLSRSSSWPGPSSRSTTRPSKTSTARRSRWIRRRRCWRSWTRRGRSSSRPCGISTSRTARASSWSTAWSTSRASKI